MKIKNYKVSWKHDNHNDKRIPNQQYKFGMSHNVIQKPNLRKVEGSTECYLTDLNQPENTFTGKSICHQNDNYNKRLGRYLSFKRAVQQVQDLNERADLWKELLATGIIKNK